MHPAPTLTPDQKFDAVLANVAAGQSLTRACTKAFTTLRYLMDWFSHHPDGKPLYASLLLAQADAATDQAEAAQAELLRRIDGGLVRDRGLGDLELARIKTLAHSAAQLRREATQLLPLEAKGPPALSWQEKTYNDLVRKYARPA